MTPANNTHHLAAARRTAAARQRAENALLAVRTSGQPVTVAKLAREANVSRSWLYTQHDLMVAIRQLGGQAPTPRSAPATERSLQVRLAAALTRNQRLQQRIDTLTEQHNQQRQQLERAYAEIRRLQALATSVSLGPTGRPTSYSRVATSHASALSSSLRTRWRSRPSCVLPRGTRPAQPGGRRPKVSTTPNGSPVRGRSSVTVDIVTEAMRRDLRPT
jgi:hypothetical protein